MKSKNINILSWKIFKDLPINCGITTRVGGISDGNYKSLNLASHTGDSFENIKVNRERFCYYIGCDPKSYTHSIQTHSDIIHLVTDHNIGLNNIEADGLITLSKNALLNIYVADCVPIVLFDKNKNIGALCHCGWKGTYFKLLQKMINVFKANYNSNLSDILIGIGPSIGSCCYNVSEDLYNKFNLLNNEGFIKEDKFYIDLKKINKNQALQLGIEETNIEIMNLCTSCNIDFLYSYRKEGESTGRFSAYLQLIS